MFSDPVLSRPQEFEYVDAPYRCNEEEEGRMPEMLKRIFPGPYHEWWNAQQVRVEFISILERHTSRR